MQVLQGDFRKRDLPLPPSVMTLGNFDGVHRGHQFLVDHVRAAADQLGLPATVLTFLPHPSHVIEGVQPVPLLFSQEDQNQQISERGIDYLVIQKFDQNFSEVAAEDFLRQYLFPKLMPQKVILGHDFLFGKGQKGDRVLFQRVAEDFEVEVMQIPAFEWKGEVVSSSKIRQSLLEGEVSRAEGLLGRPYFIESKVIKGEQLGRKLGFPTANMQGPFVILPSHGVYLGRAWVQGHWHWAIMNIGIRPTIKDNKNMSIECHILDFIGDIYGSSLRFEFLKKIRNEKKFSSLEELKIQIDQDVDFARAWVVSYEKSN